MSSKTCLIAFKKDNYIKAWVSSQLFLNLYILWCEIYFAHTFEKNYLIPIIPRAIRLALLGTNSMDTYMLRAMNVYMISKLWSSGV